jgi:hypothetical protein
MTQIRMDEETDLLVSELAEDQGITKTQAVRTLVRRGFGRTRTLERYDKKVKRERRRAEREQSKGRRRQAA